MNWKYLIIAVAKIAGRQFNMQFEVTAEDVGGAERVAKGLVQNWFDLDILEIRRL